MSRYSGAVESQAAQPAGLPVTTTFNGYFAAVVAGAACNFKLRRLFIGVRAGASVPTSQQVTVRAYRQSVRVVGTGFSTVVLGNKDQRGPASACTGIDITTAASAGTTGPTLGALPMREWTFNTQIGLDIPDDFMDEFICDLGTANGIAFVNFGNALPAAHLFTLEVTTEE